ncbi:MAG: hypothetical protein NW215_04255 [Hyphomicrobiales bacterium]|nr:hypothetical protein [Hyphomicrobiales bacterium]
MTRLLLLFLISLTQIRPFNAARSRRENRDETPRYGSQQAQAKPLARSAKHNRRYMGTMRFIPGCGRGSGAKLAATRKRIYAMFTRFENKAAFLNRACIMPGASADDKPAATRRGGNRPHFEKGVSFASIADNKSRWLPYIKVGRRQGGLFAFTSRLDERR